VVGSPRGSGAGNRAGISPGAMGLGRYHRVYRPRLGFVAADGCWLAGWLAGCMGPGGDQGGDRPMGERGGTEHWIGTGGPSYPIQVHGRQVSLCARLPMQQHILCVKRSGHLGVGLVGQTPGTLWDLSAGPVPRLRNQWASRGNNPGSLCFHSPVGHGVIADGVGSPALALAGHSPAVGRAGVYISRDSGDNKGSGTSLGPASLGMHTSSTLH
jgi:hypothetical protein